MPRSSLRLLPLALIALLLAACTPSQSMRILRGYERREAEAKQRAKLVIKWDELRNPILKHRNWSLKDACLIEKAGTFYVFSSAFYTDRGRTRSHVVGFRTKDFKRFDGPLFNWSGEELGWEGACSPNITRVDNGYVLTFNQWGDKPGEPNQLAFATSLDLENWETYKPLARNVTRDAQGPLRAIDSALAYHGGRFYLTWKEQLRTGSPQRECWPVAVSDSIGPDGWKRIGTIEGHPWLENQQFIRIEDKWRMVVSARAELPDGRHSMRTYFCSMLGDGNTEQDWLNWSELRELEIPEERFNTDDRANTGFLVDWRNKHSAFYLLYAGRTEGESHEGRGDNRLGLARSIDLRNWTTPGPTPKQAETLAPKGEMIDMEP